MTEVRQEMVGMQDLVWTPDRGLRCPGAWSRQPRVLLSGIWQGSSRHSFTSIVTWDNQ